MARRRSTNERYHDRVAARYDDHHEGDPYLALCREVSWRHLKRFLPQASGARVLDAGCGTGYFGLRLAKSGYRVDFQDLSQKMLERARAAFMKQGLPGEPRFVQGDLTDPAGLERGVYALAIAQGDVLSFVADARRCVAAVAALLAAGGVFLASLDQRHAGLEHYLERGDVDGLERFVHSGRTQWLAQSPDERFPTRSFTAAEACKLFEGAGLEVASVIGRTILPLHRHRALLKDGAVRRRLLALEEEIQRDPSALGRASHLEIVGRKPMA